MKKNLERIFERGENDNSNPFFIFELANNHGGSALQGIKIIQEVGNVCRGFKENFLFGFKFQYRDLDSFIHPAYKNRKDIKLVKRFSETRLSEKDFLSMKCELNKYNFISVCTPFDEKSVDMIEEHGFDIIKIASCSLTDWPLLERIVQTDKPIIASTAGSTIEDIDRVAAFFMNRNKKFAMMHCVAEYPTENKNLQLNQIDFLRERYPGINIGFSTHEDPNNTDSVKIAIAKRASIFEKHVGTGEGRNKYSADSKQVGKWLLSAREAVEMSGVAGKRMQATDMEKEDLRSLRRVVFAKIGIKRGKKIGHDDYFLAIPGTDNQISANNISKYVEYCAKRDIDANSPLIFGDFEVTNTRDTIEIIYKDVKDIVLKARLPLRGIVDLEISHHYGLERFYEFGCAMINLVNREYCKKMIVVLPGQTNPPHTHKKKEETFFVNYGDVSFRLGDVESEHRVGDVVLVKPGIKHGFSSRNGGIFEEVSTTHYKLDSHYEDDRINSNRKRKTFIKLRLDG